MADSFAMVCRGSISIAPAVADDDDRPSGASTPRSLSRFTLASISSTTSTPWPPVISVHSRVAILAMVQHRAAPRRGRPPGLAAGGADDAQTQRRGELPLRCQRRRWRRARGPSRRPACARIHQRAIRRRGGTPRAAPCANKTASGSGWTGARHSHALGIRADARCGRDVHAIPGGHARHAVAERLMTPAPSEPGVYGSSGSRAYLPLRI